MLKKKYRRNQKSKNLIILLSFMFFALIFTFNLGGTNELTNENNHEELFIDLNPRISGPEINITTPENKSYTVPMSGYYPATYGFENEQNGVSPADWVNTCEVNAYVQVIESLGGHNKVLECSSTSGSASEINLVRNFTPLRNNGSVEFWIRKSSANEGGPACIRIDGATAGELIAFNIDDGTEYIAYWDPSGSWTNIGYSYSDNKWMHIRIEWNCISDTYSVWIDEIQYLNNEAFASSRTDTSIKHFALYSYDIGNPALFYVDAVGFSWDPNYNIGDNLDEGLLLSFDNITTLEWMGYSLDEQTNKTISGNSAIPMPSLGLHTIQVFGNESGGTMYESDIRYFTVSPINIITPENKTYTAPMSGYYPATYGFENDVDGSNPTGWMDVSGAGCSAQVISARGGHNKVVELYDNNLGSVAEVRQDLSSRTIGAVEFWIRTTDDTKNFLVRLWDSGYSNLGVNVGFTGGYIWVYQGGNLLNSNNDQWYHIKVEFNTTADTATYYIDGINYGTYNTEQSPTEVSHIQFTTAANAQTYYGFFDGVGYSWDPDYTIGDNLDEGLLLSFDNSTTLEWMGYSLDEQTNKTILGNCSIPMPSEGLHTIQVFGNESGGTMYESDIRYYTTNFNPDLTIDTPANITYTAPMSGYYPATYGFENEQNGVSPADWVNTCEVNAYVQVIESLGSHNKVLECSSTSGSASEINLVRNFTPLRNNGSVEFWIRKSSANEGGPACIRIDGATAGELIAFNIDDGTEYIAYWNPSGSWANIGYSYSDNKWMHIRIEWNCTSDTYSVWIDEIQYLNNEAFASSRTDTSIKHFALYSYDVGNPALFYVDAVGFSWDPNYNIGDNLDEGLSLPNRLEGF